MHLASAIRAALVDRPPTVAGETSGYEPVPSTPAPSGPDEPFGSTVSRGGAQEPRATVLVEELTLLAANLLEALGDRAEEAAMAEVDALLGLAADVILVSNEVGMGIVPAYPAGRAFRDLHGRLNQHAAAHCDEVYFLVAGLPLSVK